MAEPDDELNDEQPKGWLFRLRDAGAAVGRGALIAGSLTIAGMVGLSLSVWTVVAPPGFGEGAVEQALRALDEGDDDLAHAIISNLNDPDALSPEEFSGALYALGALSVRSAERQWSAERARSDYFVASRYLEESRALSFPEGREAEGLLILGESLLNSRQSSRGVEMLRRALDAGTKEAARAHLLLAQAAFFAERPDYEQAIGEADIAIADPEVTDQQRSEAWLLRSEALSALGRGEEALASAREAQGDADEGRLALAEAQAIVAQIATATGPLRDKLNTEAKEALQRARRADQLSTSVTRKSDYLRARIAELVGRREEARETYHQIARSDGTSPAGIAAALSEAMLLQEDGDDVASLEAFRRALDAVGDPSTYRSELVSLSELRQRIRQAHAQFLKQNRYGAALELSDRIGRLMGQTERLALRARTLREWGKHELAVVAAEDRANQERLHEGRKRLREAGIAYERLAEARFATRQFTDDLWMAAETLLEGQAYAEAIRVINRYLRAEPSLRNAPALLRLGEAHLARGDHELAISALKECLEFHVNDAASFAARLTCAKAYAATGELERAESLLRHNLTRTALKTTSPEWRDSKFELGRLLADTGRYEEAISELREAILRYPDNEQSLQASYLIAYAHREAAREPLQRLQTVETVVERETARQEADEHLESALKMFRNVQNQIIRSDTTDAIARATLRNCYMIGGDVLFELSRYDEARQAFANVSTLHQNEPFMLEAFVHIYHCWRREGDRPKALGVVQQARLLLDRLPNNADFASSTNLTRGEWSSLLGELATF